MTPQDTQKKLSKDLKSFLATLGDLGQAYGDDEEQQEEDVEAEQDEQDEEGSDSEESGSEEVSDAEGEVATAPAPKAPEPLVAASLTPTPVAQKPAPVSRSGMVSALHPYEQLDNFGVLTLPCTCLCRSSSTRTRFGTLLSCLSWQVYPLALPRHPQRPSISYRSAGPSFWTK